EIAALETVAERFGEPGGQSPAGRKRVDRGVEIFFLTRPPHLNAVVHTLMSVEAHEALYRTQARHRLVGVADDRSQGVQLRAAVYGEWRVGRGAHSRGE